MTQVRVNHFDRSKPFYPLIISYLTQLIGFKELALRGAVGPEGMDRLLERIPVLRSVTARSEQKADEVRGSLRKLKGPLELRSEYQSNHITIDIDDIAHDVVNNFPYLSSWIIRSAGSLLILAHEFSKDAPWHDMGPLWEFLRHCRNAAAHGGVFNLLHGEPRRPALWGNFEITEKLRGNLLFKSDATAGLLSPGDPIRLLWDIEQAYPHMKA